MLAGRTKLIVMFLVGASCLFKPTQVNAQCTAPNFDAAINVQAAGPGPRGEFTSGDINGDGITDLVVPRFIANTISVILGNPSGAPTVVLVTSVVRPWTAGVADFNNDGKADLVVTHEPSPPQPTLALAVLLGDGAGAFGAPVDIPASLSQPLTVSDFNNDGNADVFLGNSSTNVSQLYLGNGGGGFSAPLNVVMNNNSDVVAADFNNDGKMDLATAYDGTAQVSVVLGDGTGHFGSAVPFPVSSARSIAAADFNSDGKLDLITAGQNDGVSVLLGNGMGSFGAATAFTTGFPTSAVAVGDFDGDGKADIATAGNSLVGLIIGDGSGGVAQAGNYATSQPAVNIVTGDLDGDTKLDVAVANCSGCADAASIFLGDGSGKLRSPLILPAGSSPFSITHGDLNNDGRPDLAVANITDDKVAVLLANGTGGFAPAVSFAVGTQPRSVNLGDLNSDQKLDLVTANFSGTVTVLLGDAVGGFGPATHITVPGFNPDYAAIADLNNDGVTDLAVAYLNASIVSILLGNGAGGFSAATNFTVPFGAQQLVVNDFNGDGKADLVAATISGLSVLLGNGAGGFGAANTLATPATAFSVVVSDFNGDSKADLAAAISNNNAVWVYAGDGQGGFGPPTNFPTAAGPTWIVAADYNGDGKSDVATANTLGTASVLLGNGAGGFTSSVSYVTGGNTTRSLTSADLNADGRPDLAIANQSGSASVIFNACAAMFLPTPLLSISDTTVTEGDSGTVNATFTVSLSNASNFTVGVSFYSVSTDAFADFDYQSTLGRVTFAPGTTSQTITVSVIGDTIDEFDEQFRIFLAYPLNGNLSDGRGLATILDNDPPPNVSINDVSLFEGNSGTTNANFSITLSTMSGKPIALQYATMDQNATAGADYVPQSTTVMLGPGVTSVGIPIQINGDALPESDETFLVNLSNPSNVAIVKEQGIGTILDDDPIIQFGSSTYTISETGPRVDITLTRNGGTTLGVSVSFSTNDDAGLTNCDVFNGIASPRCDYINTLGIVSFAAGQTSRTFSLAIIDDSYAEGNENFTVSVHSPVDATLGGQTLATVTITDNEATHGPNPIDNTEFFVRQQYLDFLGREPDPPGFVGWVNSINNCTGDTTQCDRIHVSQLFFQSAEFQERGYFVYRFYPVAFGRKPDYTEFVPALASVSGFLDNNQLEAAKLAFIAAFMSQPAFMNLYDPLNNTQYVDMLLNTAGVTLSTRQSLIDGLNSATLTRGQVLRHVVESNEVSTKYNHQAYAVMEYFGYLRRQPDAFYLDWIAVLDQTNDPRTMVTGFVNSAEYRQRFGP